MEVTVVIVGGGPAGLATSACLNRLSICNVILEKDEQLCSLWRKRSYDRLNLHLAKEFCTLPFMKHLPKTPNFMHKGHFLRYTDQYVHNFNVKARCCRLVESAIYIKANKKWEIRAVNTQTNESEVYVTSFLVVATGENDEPFVPRLPGLDSFWGEILHSSGYKSGLKYQNKKALVVGCGNSGMEISYDLASCGANGVSIVVRNQYGDLSSYGVWRPSLGPFFLKATTGRTPVIDVGTVQRIRAGQITVVPEVLKIDGSKVIFKNGGEKEFDLIIFATGYKSAARKWLKDYKYAFNEEGAPKNGFPLHWKGEKGLYCAGFSKRGLQGISSDAKFIAEDIKLILKSAYVKGKN